MLIFALQCELNLSRDIKGKNRCSNRGKHSKMRIKILKKRKFETDFFNRKSISLILDYGCYKSRNF